VSVVQDSPKVRSARERAGAQALRFPKEPTKPRMNLDVNYLIASFVVSSIGFVLFMYGKKMGRPLQLGVGLLLLIYPYFLSSIALLLGIAVVLIGGLWVAVRHFGL
jgi:hypothetical protein